MHARVGDQRVPFLTRRDGTQNVQLVRDPQRFDVMVTPNLYGSMIANGAIVSWYHRQCSQFDMHAHVHVHRCRGAHSRCRRVWRG